MAKSQPSPDPDGVWPSCEDQRPGVSIRPLRHADLAALLAHLDLDHDPGDTLNSGVPAPVLAMRVRASVGFPGASTHTEYRRRRATELAAWTHSLPWRIAAVLAIGLAPGCWPTRSFPTWRPRLASPWRLGWPGGCGSASLLTPWPGGAGRPGNAAPPGYWAPWSGAAGRSCTT